MKRFQMKKRNKFILTVLFVFASFFIWESIEIMGKYYATKNNKGVAVASGLYFNSDKLNKKTYLTTDKNSVGNKISFYSKIIILHLQEVQRYGKRFERHQDLLMHQQVC